MSNPRSPAFQGEDDHEASTNVRAQQPPSATTRHRSGRVFQLLEHMEDGSYRVQVWIAGQEADVPRGFEEYGRYTSAAGLTEALETLPDVPHHVVCERTDTGDTRRMHLGDLSPDDWARYDRFTFPDG